MVELSNKTKVEVISIIVWGDMRVQIHKREITLNCDRKSYTLKCTLAKTVVTRSSHIQDHSYTMGKNYFLRSGNEVADTHQWNILI